MEGSVVLTFKKGRHCSPISLANMSFLVNLETFFYENQIQRRK
jgi:hypothetical protein